MLLFCVFGSLIFCQSIALSQDKSAIPREANQKKAEQLIAGIFKDDFKQAKTPAQRTALGKTLLQQGIETEKDLAGQFVLLNKAKELAILAGDAPLAIRAVEEISKRFQIDAMESKVRTIIAVGKTAKGVGQNAALASLADKLIDEAVADDSYALANELSDAAVAASRTAKNVAETKRISAHAAEMKGIAKEYEGLKDALASLKKAPRDPQANLAVGKFRCFSKGDWDGGLPLLALGSDESVGKLARRDLAGPSSAEEQVELGDGWWAVGEQEKGLPKRRISGRAAYWYRRALPNVNGLTRTKLELRLKDAPADAASKSVYLLDMEPQEVRVMERGGVANHDEAIAQMHLPKTVTGLNCTHTIFAHPLDNSSSYIRFALGREYRELTGAAGISAEIGAEQSRTPLEFQVVGDGKVLFTSRRLAKKGESQKFTIGVVGIDKLELLVHCPGLGNWAHAVWVDPMVKK